MFLLVPREGAETVLILSAVTLELDRTAELYWDAAGDRGGRAFGVVLFTRSSARGSTCSGSSACDDGDSLLRYLSVARQRIA